MPRSKAVAQAPAPRPSRISAARRAARALEAQGQTLTRARAAAYDAGSSGRRTWGWNAPTLGPNDSMLASLETMRDRSRHAVRNDGYARGAIDRLTSNIVGSGMQPLSQADDAGFRKRLQALWLRWTDESDADRQQDWYGQQDLAARCWLEAGECFLRLRSRRAEDGLSVPLQVQILEPELCPVSYSGWSRGGNKVRAGIEFDPVGRRVAYYFYATRPGEMQDWDAGDLRRVPAESVLHLYRPLRPGQIRGVPHLSPALIRLRELDKFDDATLLRQQLAAMFVAFLRRPAETDIALEPLSGEVPVDTESGPPERPVLGLKPGLFQVLEPGEEVDFSEPPDVISGYAEYMRQQLRASCAAHGVPYEVLTGDMSGVNDRVVRVVLGEFRRWVQQLQHNHLAYQVCRPVWRAWLDQVFLGGALGIPAGYLQDAEPWARVQWQPQGWPYLHPVQDVEATQAAIRAGFTSRSAVVSEQGYDAEVIDEQQAADNERADRLQLRYDSDGRVTKQAKAPAPSPGGTPDDEPASKGSAEEKAA